MNVLGVIMARAGSKGLPGKCMRMLLGKPLIQYTLEHAAASRLLTHTVFTTDSVDARRVAERAGVPVIDRPDDLATDTAPVDAVARHAVLLWEHQHEERVSVVVLLYGNIPVRTKSLIDRAVDHLIQSDADSVRSVAPVSKQHPDWLHRLDGDVMAQFRANSIYRRQDLEPLYYHDGAVAVVTRSALFAATDRPDDLQAFLGSDRRAVIQRPEDAVDVDEPADLLVAEAFLRTPGKGNRAPMPVTIGSHRVGAGARVLLVAEAGVNHDGSVETALRMVDSAVDAGADAVKFQAFRAADLVARDAPMAAYQQRGCGASSQRTMLSRLELSTKAFARIKERCAQRGIMFLATPFGPSDVSRLVELEVPAIKIASTDLVNEPLVNAAADTGLPIILSTGASTEQEICASVERICRAGAGDRLVLLHCVSAYPTPLEAANLRAVASLERTCGVPCGLSDHTTSTQTGGWAVGAGARVLEKHFTLDRTRSGPDHAMSLTPAQLAEYVANVRAAEKAMGDGTVGMTPREVEVRAVAGRSVVAAVDIPAGTTLTGDMLTVKRPGTGIPASDLAAVPGHRASVDIQHDTVLSWDLLQ
jgi:N-acetylneuraminate synthase/N,N'-diacetyllegionaminate synthase